MYIYIYVYNISNNRQYISFTNIYIDIYLLVTEPK